MNYDGDCRTAPATPGLLNIFLEMWTFMGVKNCVTHILHALYACFQTFLSLKQKTKKMAQGKLFFKYGLRYVKNGFICPYNDFEKKVYFFSKSFYGPIQPIFKSALFFQIRFYGQMKPFFHKSETIFSKQFSLSIFSCFLFEAQECLENCINCV